MRRLIILFCFILISLTGFAQSNNKNKKAPPKKADAPVQQAATDADEITAYVYKPKGRRDPFWDLLRGSGEERLRREVKEGIAGLEIDQLELEGIVFRNGKYIALFKGPDSHPYDVRVGQSVYDGEIIKIDANSVWFKKILTIALGGTKEKTIIKRLNPEKENEK